MEIKIKVLNKAQFEKVDLSGLEKHNPEFITPCNLHNIRYYFDVVCAFEGTDLIGAAKLTRYPSIKSAKRSNLTWVEVIKPYRRKGIATKILEEVNKKTMKDGSWVSYCEGPKQYRSFMVKLVESKLERCIGEVLGDRCLAKEKELAKCV